MAYDIDAAKTRLETAIARIDQELSLIDETKAGGLPNARGGVSIDHVGYVDGLTRRREALVKALCRLQGSRSRTYGVDV